MNLESKREGLRVGEDHPNKHNGSPIVSNNAVDNVAEISSIEQSELVAATTPREVAHEAVRRELPVYWEVYIDGLCRELMQPWL